MKPELLAPVGSFQSLRAAIVSGADAVYLGLDQFQARAKATDFTRENIAQITRMCHIHGVQVYITCNTCVLPQEYDAFAEYVDACAKARVDAFIVTDFGTLDIFRKYDIPLHASTQMGIHNLAGAKVAEALGFTRVVLSREALLSDIREIHDKTDLEIEYFVHGALCVSFSGGCLLSSMMCGESGNRGRCTQPCRQQYVSSLNNAQGYWLSPSDQCLISQLNALIQAGVTSLKIEGRLKQPHYVGEVVRQYRRALDRIGSPDLGALERAYNRGHFTQGYNFDATRDIMSPNVQGNIGQKVGKVIRSGKGFSIVKFTRNVQIGDGLKFLNAGKEVGGMRLNEAPNPKDNTCRIPMQLPIGADVCLTLDQTQVEEFAQCLPKRGMSVSVLAKVGMPLTMQWKSGNCSISVSGSMLTQAEKNPVTAEQIRAQVARLGDTDYVLEDCTVETDGKAFVASSECNRLRREAVAALSDAIVKDWESNQLRVDYSAFPYRLHNSQSMTSRMAGLSQLTHSHPLDRLQPTAPSDRPMVISDRMDVLENAARCEAIGIWTTSEWNVSDVTAKLAQLQQIAQKYGVEMYLYPPKIVRGEAENARMREIAARCKQYNIGFLCDNLSEIGLSHEFSLAAIGGIGLNLYSESSARILGLTRYIASVELSRATIEKYHPHAAVFAYGPLPVMTLTHCPIQLQTKCNCADCKYRGPFEYRNKRDVYRIERTRIKHCYFTLYNSGDLDLRGKYEKTAYQTVLNMVQSDWEQVEPILQDFLQRKGTKRLGTTTGHWTRGVE